MATQGLHPPTMRIDFDTTSADHEYLVRRAIGRASRSSTTIRRRRLRQMVFTAGCGGFVFAVLNQGSVLSKTLFGCVGALLGVVLWMTTHRRGSRRLITTLAHQQHPPGTTQACSVELADDGVHASSPDGSSCTPWTDIVEIEDLEASIDIWTADDGLVVVPKRAFADADQQDEFLEVALRYIDEADVVELSPDSESNA